MVMVTFLTFWTDFATSVTTHLYTVINLLTMSTYGMDVNYIIHQCLRRNNMIRIYCGLKFIIYPHHVEIHNCKMCALQVSPERVHELVCPLSHHHKMLYNMVKLLYKSKNVSHFFFTHELYYFIRDKFQNLKKLFPGVSPFQSKSTIYTLIYIYTDYHVHTVQFY